MTILKVSGPFDEWRPDPFPGSAAALEEGCSCPSFQHAWPRHLMMNSECPVHALDKVPPGLGGP
jgi:hypothetical protein